MTLTVQYSEKTAKNVEHFKKTATKSTHRVTHARKQEEYKQKETHHALTLTHTCSDPFAPLLRPLTHTIVSTHACPHS